MTTLTSAPENDTCSADANVYRPCSPVVIDASRPLRSNLTSDTFAPPTGAPSALTVPDSVHGVRPPHGAASGAEPGAAEMGDELGAVGADEG